MVSDGNCQRKEKRNTTNIQTAVRELLLPNATETKQVGGVLYVFSWIKSKESRDIEGAIVVSKLTGISSASYLTFFGQY